MKLSTAILKGSKGRYQGCGDLLDSQGKVCALGAACYGVGIVPRVGTQFSSRLARKFPILRSVKIKDDDYPEALTLESLIADKNDSDWSFKKIATWLRKLGY